MAEQISIRVTKNAPSALEIEQAVVRLGISKNQLFTEGIRIMCAFDKESYETMKQFFADKQAVAEREFCAALMSGLKGGVGMDDNKRFELAEFLKELRDRKSELEEQVKGLNAEIESVTAELIADLIENESTGFNHKGFNYSLVVKEYPAAEPERKDELYAVMKKQGFEGLFTINTNTLSATIKDLKSNNDGVLPPWLDGLIKIAEKSIIQIRRGRKV